MNHTTPKSSRTLDIYARLCEGKSINKSEEAQKFCVDERTIQRDIDDIRAFLDERAISGTDSRTIKYNRQKRCFEMNGTDGYLMSNAEILATSKILLESRAFTKKEISSILDKMISNCVPQENIKMVSDLIKNEKFHYSELKNKKPLKDIIWDIGNFIKDQRIIETTYNKQSSTEKQVKRLVEPISIIFSEYYFYLLANPLAKAENGYEKTFDYPTIYRIDRIVKCTATCDKYRIDYANKFEEGVFRKQIQFMYAGELEHVQFRYTGINVEAILDRLPTAKIVSNDSDGYVVSASVYGQGLMMWLLSQGDNVEVLKPKSYRDKMKHMLTKMLEMYEKYDMRY